jgi:hypothetical protein
MVCVRLLEKSRRHQIGIPGYASAQAEAESVSKEQVAIVTSYRDFCAIPA